MFRKKNFREIMQLLSKVCVGGGGLHKIHMGLWTDNSRSLAHRAPEILKIGGGGIAQEKLTHMFFLWKLSPTKFGPRRWADGGPVECRSGMAGSV